VAMSNESTKPAARASLYRRRDIQISDTSNAATPSAKMISSWLELSRCEQLCFPSLFLLCIGRRAWRRGVAHLEDFRGDVLITLDIIFFLCGYVLNET
jgi:hypothetical protein